MAEKLEYDSYYGVLNLGSNALAEAIYVKMECEDVDAALATAAHRYNAFPALLEALKGAQAFVSRDCQDLIESCSLDGTTDTLDESAREDVADYQAVLDKINAAISQAEVGE